jgi:hypothetical protein
VWPIAHAASSLPLMVSRAGSMKPFGDQVIDAAHPGVEIVAGDARADQVAFVAVTSGPGRAISSRACPDSRPIVFSLIADEAYVGSGIVEVRLI